MLATIVCMISVAGDATKVVCISPAIAGGGGGGGGAGVVMPTVGISPPRALTAKVRVNNNAAKQSLNFFMVSPDEQLMGE